MEPTPTTYLPMAYLQYPLLSAFPCSWDRESLEKDTWTFLSLFPSEISEVSPDAMWLVQDSTGDA